MEEHVWNHPTFLEVCSRCRYKANNTANLNKHTEDEHDVEKLYCELGLQEENIGKENQDEVVTVNLGKDEELHADMDGPQEDNLEDTLKAPKALGRVRNWKYKHWYKCQVCGKAVTVRTYLKRNKKTWMKKYSKSNVGSGLTERTLL